MTEKNFEYYKNKTKADAAKRKAADPKRESRAKSAVLAAYFFAIGWRLFLINIWRLLLIGAGVASLVFGAIAYHDYSAAANLSLIILFAIVNIGVITFTTATFWRRGLWVVTIIALVLGIFAFMVPFYSKQCASKFTDCIEVQNYNLYGQELNY